MKNVSLTGRASGSFGSTVKRVGLASVAVLTMAVASTANATPTATEARPATLRMRMLADNVVVSPGGSAPAAPAQAAPQTVVVPQASAPAASAEPAKQTNVHADVQGPKNYMSTIAVSALMGGLAGGLVGGAIYFLGDRDNEINIAYWAAGGVLLGTGVGITQVLVQESRVSNAAASRFPSDPAPTMRLALLRLKF